VADNEPFLIRSYRVCFELERRIHQVDRWRIPVPYGIPLRGLAYAALVLAAVLVAGRLPLIGAILGLLHPALRLVVIPVVSAALLTRLRVDGRPAHAAALAWVRWRAGARRLSALRPSAAPAPARLPDVELVPDEDTSHYRPARIGGPCELTLRYPASARRRGRTLELRQSSERPMWRGKRIALRPGQRVRVR
jgi:hypothetical protein